MASRRSVRERRPTLFHDEDMLVAESLAEDRRQSMNVARRQRDIDQVFCSRRERFCPIVAARFWKAEFSKLKKAATCSKQRLLSDNVSITIYADPSAHKHLKWQLCCCLLTSTPCFHNSNALCSSVDELNLSTSTTAVNDLSTFYKALPLEIRGFITSRSKQEHLLEIEDPDLVALLHSYARMANIYETRRWSRRKIPQCLGYYPDRVSPSNAASNESGGVRARRRDEILIATNKLSDFTILSICITISIIISLLSAYPLASPHISIAISSPSPSYHQIRFHLHISPSPSSVYPFHFINLHRHALISTTYTNNNVFIGPLSTHIAT